MTNDDRSTFAAMRRRPRAAAAGLGLLLLIASAPAFAAAAASQASFATPAKAAEALAAAWRDGHSTPMLALFGPAGLALVRSGDTVADTAARRRLAASYDQSHRIEVEGAGKAVLILGREAWPYPIPMVKRAGTWRFDVEAGAQQIIDRRIGRDEMQAIKTAQAYVQAQRDYAARTAAGGGRREYAMNIRSAEGRRDGLYWPASSAGGESPLGPLVAAAEASGYGPPSNNDRQPFHGYIIRILTSQGPHAPGGARSYVVDGHMTGGYALIAFPAKYGDSGVMTFIVNQHGIVFEKNLGPATDRLARAVTAYDPDATWKAVAP